MKEILTSVQEIFSSLIGSSDKKSPGAKLFLCHISIPGKLAVVSAVILMVSFHCGPIETAAGQLLLLSVGSWLT